MSHSPNALVREAARAVGSTLHDIKYAVVGGAACAMLGSNRVTTDVDIVVPRGGTKAARMRLAENTQQFKVDRRTLHTEYRAEDRSTPDTSDTPDAPDTPRNPPVMIEILTPPTLFRAEFTQDTPVYAVDGVKILKPTLLLDAKCGAMLSRAGAQGKDKDAKDILFLLQWCIDHDMLPTSRKSLPRQKTLSVVLSIPTADEIDGSRQASPFKTSTLCGECGVGEWVGTKPRA